jgi:hypothetical protein
MANTGSTLGLNTEDRKGHTSLVQGGIGTQMRLSVKCAKRSDVYFIVVHIYLIFLLRVKHFQLHRMIGNLQANTEIFFTEVSSIEENSH